MTNKITKRDNFNALLSIPAVADNADLVAFIEHEIELLDKKNASRKTELTETQKENLGYMDQIMDYLAGSTDPKSVSAIAKQFGLSTQKVTPMIKKLAEQGKVVGSTVKRVNYYTVA